MTDPVHPTVPIDTTTTRLLTRRLMVTVAGVVIYAVGMQIPLPAIDRATVLEYLSRNPDGLFAIYDVFTGGTLSKPTVFTFGVMPYVVAVVLLVLLSGIVPQLRQLRDGDGQANRTFDRWIYALTAAIALTQSWGHASMLHAVQSASGMLVAGIVARVAITAAATAGTMFLVWIAHQLTSYGVANGIVVLLFAALVADLGSNAIAGLGLQAEAVAVGIQTPTVPVLLLVGAALIAASVVAVRAARPLTLVQSGTSRRRSDPPSPDPQVRLRINSAGILPLWTANMVAAPLPYVGIGYDRWVYWVLYGIAVIGFAYLWTAVTFSSKDLTTRIEAWGYRLADISSEEDTAARVDSIVERSILPYAFFLAVLAATPVLLYDGLNVNWTLASVLGPSLLMAAAMAVAIIQGSAVLVRMGSAVASASDHPVTTSWVPVFRGETDLDADIVRSMLQSAGIPSARYSNRAISITGSLAFWESARPSFPALTIYRRLGGGEVYALVPRGRVNEAVRLLNSRGIVDDRILAARAP